MTACARRLGPRRFFTTAQTVADLDALRARLGVARVSLLGVSYGTLVAERYALAHPDRVARLVLDSVVPRQGANVLWLQGMRAAARVLRAACAAQRCSADPVRDLAAAVRARRDGPALLDTLTTLSIARPSLRGIPAALHAARAGRPGRLDAIVAGVRRADRAAAGQLGQGLHASALCAESPAPWPGSSTPPARRAAALRRSVARLRTAATYPFDRATAAGNGFAQTCLRWPPEPAPPPAPSGDLPAVPVLLLAGGRDLSTPLEWARAEAAHALRGRLVVAPRSGRSVLLRGRSAKAMRALTRFLAG